MKQMYMMRDLVGQAFVGPVMVLGHEAVAIRTFADLIADPQTLVHKHPRDFALYRLGTFDEAEGITSSEAVVVIDGATMLAAQGEGVTS